MLGYIKNISCDSFASITRIILFCVYLRPVLPNFLNNTVIGLIMSTEQSAQPVIMGEKGYIVVEPFVDIGTGNGYHEKGVPFLNLKLTDHVIHYSRLVQVSPEFAFNWTQFEGRYDPDQRLAALKHAGEIVRQRDGGFFCFDFVWHDCRCASDYFKGFESYVKQGCSVEEAVHYAHKDSFKLVVTPLNETRQFMLGAIRQTFNIPRSIPDAQLEDMVRKSILGE